MLKTLIEHLRSRKESIVRTVEYLEPNWSPTYGEQDPSTCSMDVIEFDALLAAIDEFADSFKGI